MMGDTWTYLERTPIAFQREFDPNVASTSLGAKRYVTAGSHIGKLQVNVWELGNDGLIKQLDYKEGEATSGSMAVAALSIYRFVTVECFQKMLKLTLWDVYDNGKINKRAQSTTDPKDKEFQGKPAVATFSDNLIVTAACDNNNVLNLITWKVTSTLGIGSYELEVTRWGTAVEEDEEVEALNIDVAAYDPYPPDTGNLATAVLVKGQKKLKIINWRIRIDGRIDRQGHTYGDEATHVAAATLSHRRIVTATRNLDNRLELQTWDFDAQGNVSLHDSTSQGNWMAFAFDVTTLSATRVITAIKNQFQELMLLVWDAVDDIILLGGKVDKDPTFDYKPLAISVVALGSDWIVTSNCYTTDVEGDYRLRTASWKEHAVSLLRSEWKPGSTFLEHSKPSNLQPKPTISFVVDDDQDLKRAEEPVLKIPEEERSDTEDLKPTLEPAGEVPFISNKFFPGIEGVDPMIAVGFNYIIVSQEEWIAFFDKNGKRLKDKNNKWISLRTDFFFSNFLAGRKLDGSPNEHCINRHTQFPPNGPYLYPPCFANCDPDSKDTELEPGKKYKKYLYFPLPPCMREFYDTRVHFDPVSQRFFVLAFCRPGKIVKGRKIVEKEDTEGINTNKLDNLFNRRYWAFAVSKTEDPRDGFYQWMSTEPYVADACEFTVNNGVMVVSKRVGDQPHQPFGIKPLVFVLSVEDLIMGKPYPRSHKFHPNDFPDYVSGYWTSLGEFRKGGDLIPIVHYGDTAGLTFLLHGKGEEGVDIYSFKNPSNWDDFSPIKKTSSVIVNDNGDPIEVKHPTYFPPKFRDGKIYLSWMKEIKIDTFYVIRLIRLPLKSLSTYPTPSTNKSDGYIYRRLGTSATDDPPNYIVSYEEPSITVNKDGHMVILFCRAGFDPQYPLYPEARYTIWYADNRGLQGSKLIQAGTPSPTGSSPRHPVLRLHYQTAVVDPSDDRTVWMISEFSYNGEYKTVVAKVTP